MEDEYFSILYLGETSENFHCLTRKHNFVFECYNPKLDQWVQNDNMWEIYDGTYYADPLTAEEAERHRQRLHDNWQTDPAYGNNA